MKEEIIFLINSDGRVTIDVKGASGCRCLEKTQSFEKAIGDVLWRQKTGGYYCSTNVTLRSTIRLSDH